MKTWFKSSLMALGILTGGLTASGGLYIPEPSTVIYGRVFQLTGTREFPIMEGDLVWRIRNLSQAGKEYTLRAKLQPVGNGQYSYRLEVPHQVLAYDLTVADNAVPLSSSGARFQHAAVTVNGRPANLVAPAVDTFTAMQSARACAYRIDLQIAEDAADSDGDGYPDWWEDQNGYDKWDPLDAPATPPGNTTGNSALAASAKTFAEWRSALFPSNTTDLEVFGHQDPDQDGVCNLLEYAFKLDPNANDTGTVGTLPSAYVSGGRAGVTFPKRANATDLTYSVDVSDNLLEWRDGSAEVEEVTPPSGAPNQSAFLSLTSISANDARYFRLRVTRK